MRNKVENILKSSLKRKIRITQALLTVFLITGTVSFSAEEKIININITNVGEQTGLELGTNSRARGTGAIATGKNSIAIGKNAVATGENENKATIEAKIAADKQKLADIENAQAELNRKTNELMEKQVRERATIEAGIRVEQIKKAKANAKLKWEESLSIYNTEKNNSSDFFKTHQTKIDDLNSRLAGLSKIQGINISSDEGLTNAATQLKKIAENGTNLNLTLDFYKDYVTSYYKALGDIRESEIISSKSLSHMFDADMNNNQIAKGDYSHLKELNNLSFGLYLSPYGNYYGLAFYSPNGYLFSKDSFKNKKGNITITNNPTKDLKIINIETDIVTLEEFNEFKAESPKYKQSFKEYFQQNNDRFLTFEIKEKMYEVFNLKMDINQKRYEIAYYQGEYEKTKQTTWLDKKAVAKKQLENMLSDFNKLENISSLKQNEIDKFKKENITSVVEKNKITVATLTSELEQALGINKEAVLNKEKELEALKNKAEQDKKNYEGLNPSEADMILAREYDRVKAEINALSGDIVQADERLRALKEALTLQDLTNIGENQIAQGTNALAVGNNSIAVGKSTSSIGLDSIAIGTNATTTGEKSISIGADTVTVGSKNVNIGNNNTIAGDNNFVLGSNINITKDVNNSVVLGNNSTVSGSNEVSVGSVGKERKIINVADGEISTTSKEAINGSQLKRLENTLNSYVKLDGSNIDSDSKSSLITKLSENANINSPTNTLVTDSNVKEYLDSKNYAVKTDLDILAKKDGSNIKTEKYIEKLSEGANLNNPTNKLVTDTIVKAGLDTKVDKTVYATDKQTLESAINSKANITDLTNKANISGDNIEKAGFTTVLTTGADISNPTNTLVTDTIVKAGLDAKANISDVYTKNEVDNKISNVTVKTEADVISTTLDIKNGENRIIGTENISIELKNNSISKDKLNNTLKSEIDNKVNINGDNIVNIQDKADFRNNIEVYSKDEIENKLNSITINGADLTGEITATEEKGVTGKTIYNYVSKRDALIINNYNEIQKNKIAIAENTRRINEVEKDIKKVGALTTAMAAIEYPKVGVGEVAVGAGITSFRGEQGVAVGAQYMPIEDLLLGIKYAGLTSDRYRGAVGGSIGYKFRLHD